MNMQNTTARMKEIAFGYWTAQCVHAAAELSLADLLAEGPRTCASLASAAGCDPDALQRLLRALTGIGLFREGTDGRFELNEMADLLRSGNPGSMKAELLHVLHPSSWAAWSQLTHCVRTGKAGFPEALGQDAWQYREAHPEAGAIFDAMAESKSKQEAAGVLANVDFERVTEVVDVGGGTGALLAEILKQKPGLRGVLFDRPQVVAAAVAVFEAAGVASRCRAVGGDFFAGVPGGGDLYLVKAILHNWTDEAALAILRTCRRAMAPSARLVIIDLAVEPQRPSFVNLMDLHMLVVHGGRERTAEEMTRLLEAAGFRASAPRMAGPVCFAEGRPGAANA